MVGWRRFDGKAIAQKNAYVEPGLDIQSNEALATYIRAACDTMSHPVGTCKMGIDPMAVVDSELRVHGIDGLRVVDVSIMPTMTTGNTNAPTIMIGEKAADFIKSSQTRRTLMNRYNVQNPRQLGYLAVGD